MHGARLRRSIKLNLAALMICVALASCWSKFYWGYFFVRPSIGTAFDEITQVASVTAFTSSPSSADVRPQITVSPAPTLSSAANFVKQQNDPTGVTIGRPLERLDELGRIRETFPTISAQQAGEVVDWLKSAGVIEVGKGVYKKFSTGLRGLILHGRDKTGQEHWWVTAQSGQLSNDHYALYEARFTVTQDAAPALTHSKRFYIDIAGIEGLNTFVAASLLFGVWLLLKFLTQPFVSFFRGRRLHSTTRQHVTGSDAHSASI